MSFQGDVAGIGLGELLQGLARGGRDGVLSLSSAHAAACLGIRNGVLHLLSGPDEDEQTWRERSLQAWAHDPQPLLEAQRRQTIARAQRLETFHGMLETKNLHFRFEPGPLPLPETGEQADADTHGSGLAVEYVLLEHARLADERSGSAHSIEACDIPRAVGHASVDADALDFPSQCDGRSTLQEIADRMGLPLRQCRLAVLGLIKSGSVRVAPPRELLAAAQHELAAERVGRAATRLTGWVRSSPPGHLDPGDAQLLLSEADLGRLSPALARLAARDARALLRRLDHVQPDLEPRCERWRKLAESHRDDDLCRLHAAALHLATTDQGDARTFTDLLDLARGFQESERPLRTRTLLRLASLRLPAEAKLRVELGLKMLETDLVEEGVRWLLDVARELIGSGDGERALTPLRAVLTRMPEHIEARALVIEARALIARRRKRRWKSLVTASLALMFSLSGVVHMKGRHTDSELLDHIQNSLSRPELALALLDEHFPDDDSERVSSLRATAYAFRNKADDDRRAAWQADFDQLRQACEYGDPVLGLRGALDLQPRPEGGSRRAQPTRADLLSLLTARLETRQREVDLPVHADPQELNAEQELQDLLHELLALCEERRDEDDVVAFHFRLEELGREITARRRLRAEGRELLLRDRTEVEQDVLLGAARAHEAAGDLERAVQAYERLARTSEFEELAPILAAEIAAVQAHHETELEAVALADAGDHAGALARLERGCPRDPAEHLLPWRITTTPPGARATLSDGRTGLTPMVVDSHPGQAVEVTLEYDSFEVFHTNRSGPADLQVHLRRRPERSLSGDHRVQALPIPIGDDHVVADRQGRVLRLTSDSTTAWQTTLPTLAGVARTPLLLPDSSGRMLVIAEDARVWWVDSEDGGVEGPIELEAAPDQGPYLTRRGAWLKLKDGRFATWADGIQPSYVTPEGSFVEPDAPAAAFEETAPASITFLRPDVNGATHLTQSEGDWTVEILAGEYRVTDAQGLGFTARRVGEWSFVAWEQATAHTPLGRLWVSDQDGLRSYRPDQGLSLRHADPR